MESKRAEKFKRVIKQRQFDLSVLLENVHDQHNIGAVLRSCDSVGISEIYLLYTDEVLQKDYVRIGKRTSSGARKWVDVHYFTDVDLCFEAMSKKYSQVLATHLNEEAKSLYELDLNASTVIVFGNEKDGISKETLKRCTGNFIIPQMGMTESLNISVACAVTLYEAARQRLVTNAYDGHRFSKEEYADLEAQFLERHKSKSKRSYVNKEGQVDYKFQMKDRD